MVAAKMVEAELVFWKIDFGKKSTLKTEVMRSVWQLKKGHGGADVVQALKSY